VWRRDSKELFFLQGAKLMAAPIRLTEASFASGKPQALFEVPADASTGDAPRYAFTRFQVSRDGRRFLLALPAEGPAPELPRLNVVSSWQAALRK
jgi:hypothetical protein